MKRLLNVRSNTSLFTPSLLTLLAFALSSLSLAAQPSPAANAAYDAYLRTVELRLARQHQAQADFLASVTPGSPRDRGLRGGELFLENLTPGSSALPGALIHHWRATAFVPGATAAEFDCLLRSFSAYPRIFAPQIEQVSLLGSSTESALITMRMVQHHGLTVVLDGTFRVTFGRRDALHKFSASASTGISEIASTGSTREHAIAPGADHGFLWRTNTFWSYEERDGGLYLQIESVSLTRSIPFGMAWVIRPYTETIPRDSLTFTLNAARRALEHTGHSASSTTFQPHTERTRACPSHR
jgi:hypothetical protein